MFDELLKSIYQYLNGVWTLQILQEWLLSNLQDILNSGNNHAIDIANEIDADLVQLSEDIIDENTLQGRMERYRSSMETISVNFQKQHRDISSATVIETIRLQVDLSPVADLYLSHTFA